MLRVPAMVPATRSRCQHPRAALALAIATACLPDASAWAADICTTPTTTISVNTNAAGGDSCILDPAAESLVVQAGVSLTMFNSDSVRVVAGTTTGSVDNSGTIQAGLLSAPIRVAGGTLAGGILNRSGATIDGPEGIWLNCNGIVQNGIVNAGTIKSTGPGFFRSHAIKLTCTTAQISGGITNTGQLLTTLPGLFGIANTGNGSIDFVSNLQGGATPLTYTGKLPNAYRIIVNSPASFGILAATNPNSAMTFNINSGSTLQAGIYPGVLTGITAANLAGSLTGVFGQFTWQLVQTAPASNVWNLVVTLAAVPAALPATPIPALPVLGGAVLAGLVGVLGALGIRRRRSAR